MDWTKLIEVDFGIRDVTHDPKLLYALIRNAGGIVNDKKPLSKAFILACEGGHMEMVKYLLTRFDVDPGYNKSESLARACESDNYELVKILLNDPRVDISENVIKAALKFERILSFLLSVGSICDPKYKRMSPKIATDGLDYAIFVVRNPVAIREFIKKGIHPMRITYGNIYPTPEVMRALLESDKIKIDSNLVKMMLLQNRDVAELMTQHKSFTGDKLALLGTGG